jgi:nucleotide-binding universal stress UspA family protein
VPNLWLAAIRPTPDPDRVETRTSARSIADALAAGTGDLGERKEVTPMKKQFLIATDGLPGAHEAVQQGLALAREAGATVTLAYVRHAPLPVLGDPFYQRALSDEFARARVVLEEAADSAARAGTEVRTEILEGDPAEAIVQLGRAREVDLIVVGSRGRGSIAGALLGSVSEGIVHRADRPVLVVKPRSKAVTRAA